MKKHIALVCTRLDLPGGIERASVNLANLLQNNGHQVTIVIADETKNSFYPIDPCVHLEQLNIDFGITKKGNVVTRKIALTKDILQLRKVFRKLDPDVVIGTEYHLTISSWMATRRLKIKIIGWEHLHIHFLKKNKFWSYLSKKIYPKLDYVVCQNQTETDSFKKIGCNSITIPYSIRGRNSVKAGLRSKTILTVGWLTKTKGVDMIPDISEKVFSNHKDWHWKIIGKGEEFDKLNARVIDKKLSPFISITKPISSELKDQYLSTSIFVMTSRFECLPMVLLEATSFGIPCIAFDCPTGPAHIIQNNKNGFIVPLENVSLMANAINELIENENKRMEMGEQAYKSSDRYLPGKIYELWNEIFEA